MIETYTFGKQAPQPGRGSLTHDPHPVESHDMSGMTAVRNGLLVITLLVATLPGSTAAVQRDGFANRVNAISTSTDTAALGRMVDGPAGPAAADAVALLTRGFAGMRLFAITGNRERADRARDAFERAGDLDPDNAWAWYGLGLTWAQRINRDPPRVVMFRALAEALGSDPTSRALHALRRSLELDPGLTPAAVALVPLAIGKHDEDALRMAGATLSRDQVEGRFSVPALDALARAALALGNPDIALEAARRVATANGDEPAATYRLAHALFAAGMDEEGRQAWFNAVARLTPDLARNFFDDLRPVADDWERERWERLDLDGRQDWLREFWTTRSALAGMSVATRIGDHYRRLDVANRRYYRRRKWGAPPRNALLLERPDLPFDDRGLIYVRHGEPVRILHSMGTFSRSDESWIYRGLDGEFRMFHFFRYASASRSSGVAGNPASSFADGEDGDAYNEFVLVYVLPCGDWVDDRIPYDPRLRLLCRDDVDRRTISAEVRRDARAGLRFDSDAPDFDRALPFVWDLYTFRGNDDATDVIAGVVLPADSLTPSPAWQGVAWDLDVSFVVADTSFGRVARVDTTLRLRRDRRPPTATALRLTLSMPVVPGTHQAQRLVVKDALTPRHGRLVGRELDVPDYAGHDLMLSDIVLAEPDSGGSFRRGDIALGLVPTREFRGGAFRAYYEIYNLTPDASFTTTIEVENVRGGISRLVHGLFGGGPVARLRFDGIAPPTGTLSRQLRRVDTELEPGNYRLRVRVTDRNTGRSTEKDREFTVVR